SARAPLGVHLPLGSARGARLRPVAVSRGSERVRQRAQSLAEAPSQATARARKCRRGTAWLGRRGAAYGRSPQAQRAPASLSPRRCLRRGRGRAPLPHAWHSLVSDLLVRLRSVRAL